MTFKRYNYCLQWYGKDVNDSELLGYPIEVDNPLNREVLNTLFDMYIIGLNVKRINLSLNGNIKEIYNIIRERFMKALEGIFS